MDTKERLKQCKKDIATLEENKRKLETELRDKEISSVKSIMLADFQGRPNDLRIVCKTEVLKKALNSYSHYGFLVFNCNSLQNWFNEEDLRDTTGNAESYKNMRPL